MGELRFSPVRLSECKTRIDSLSEKLREYTDEALALINTLDPQDQFDLLQPLRGLIENNEEIMALSDKLARLVILYSDCERAVEDIVKRLLLQVFPSQHLSTAMPTTLAAAAYTPSQTMPRDLFVESWIMELMYADQNTGGQ